MAALCDFRIERVEDTSGRAVASPKHESRSGGFRLVLAPAAKVLPRLRGWFPDARRVGWKYELAGTREEAFEKVWRQLRECGTDACVLNGRAYGPGFAFCTPDGKFTLCSTVPSLADHLASWLEHAPVVVR